LKQQQNCYRDGRGVDKCSTEAFKWFLKAARHDCPAAQNSIGLALLNGDGCRKNETSARSWFQKAVEQDIAVAQHNYAIMLEEGRGGPINAKKAAELLQLSADQGIPGSLERLQKLSRSGALGGSSMEKNKENLKKTASKSDPTSLFLLGQNYLKGTGGFDKDLHQAEQHLREASKAGYADANLPLGKLLLELKRNDEAFEFIRLSAEKGSAVGQFELGMLFAFGLGCVVRDEAKARRWFNRAKQLGFSVECNDSEGETPKDDWVEKLIDVGREVFEFETHQQLKSEGMSIPERKKRCMTSKLYAENPASSALVLDILYPPLTPIVQKMKVITPECLKVLISRAENGSTTAQSFFKACEMVDKAMDLLKRKQTNDAFKLIRLSLREWDLPIPKYSYFYLDCIEVAKEVLDCNSQDVDALYVLACLDSTHSAKEKLRMAKRCVELDPSVPDFHQLLSCTWEIVGDYKNGLRAVDRAIELLPDQTDWLFGRVKLLLRLLYQNREEKKEEYGVDVAEAFLKFISSNPMDNRNIPEACYYLVQIYVLSDVPKAKIYYQKGLEAEDGRIRLPCFEPLTDDFPPKKFARMMLDAYSQGMGMPLRKTVDADGTAQEKMTNQHCANCFKSNQTFRCSTCKSVWYCDRACQVAHWKKHKVDCKRLLSAKN